MTIEFQPSADQAWQFWANHELTQSATCCSMFARVHKAELTKIGGSIGERDGDWKIPTAESREKDLEKLYKMRHHGDKQNLSPDNFHKKELEYMAENSLRQLGPPRIGKFADRQRPESMHLEVNNWQHLLDVIYLLVLQDDCFEQFYEVLSNPTKDGGCGEKFVADRIKEHYNSADKF